MKPIEDIEIAKIESLLLPHNSSFSENGNTERFEIIKEIDNSCDVVACPGSGKTTVLLAKLLLLAERLPFEDNSGICVLTHTNIAIAEIKKKAGIKADVLFRYPNFFGTFQSFVDKFLAIPAYTNYTKKRVVAIDNEIACSVTVSA